MRHAILPLLLATAACTTTAPDMAVETPVASAESQYDLHAQMAKLAVVQMAPDNAAAHAGLVRALVQAGHTEQAQAAFDAVDPLLAEDPLMQTAKSALELAGTKVDDSELQALRAKAAEQPADMQAQFDFAEAAYAAGERDEAADTLLKMVESDGEWNDGAAKAKLLQIFEAVGLEDPWVVATRRRLSKILFG